MMNWGDGQPHQQASALKSDTWDVKADNWKFQLVVSYHQMEHLKVTEKAAFKDETEQLSNLSASGKENKCLFPVKLKIEDQERLEPITQGPGTDRNTCKKNKTLASDTTN